MGNRLRQIQFVLPFRPLSVIASGVFVAQNRQTRSPLPVPPHEKQAHLKVLVIGQTKGFELGTAQQSRGKEKLRTESPTGFGFRIKVEFYEIVPKRITLSKSRFVQPVSELTSPRK